MTAITTDLFAGGRHLQMTESIELTVQSLRAYAPDHDHWGMAWSGGKDSSATLTLLVWLIKSGQVSAPRSLTVFYADTRMELTPLAIAAAQIMDELRDRGIEVQVVRAPLDKRFLVYILGRGVPPPNNNTLRWCTRQIKIDPMGAAIAARLGRPVIDLLDAEEEARIRELIAAKTWPDGWTGDEPTADVPLPSYFADGTIQELLV